jgi:hypothetical protein
MDLQIAVIAVGLAGEQALELALGDLDAQGLELRLGFGDDPGIALRLAELDEAELILELALDQPIAVDRAVELVALAQQRLRRRWLLPQVGVFRVGVQLIEAARCIVPVKDASSAGPARRVPPRPPLKFQRASKSPWK